MVTIRRLTDSCLHVTTDTDATLFDPGFHTFESGEIDLGSIGDVTRVFITHEHRDHVNAGFIRFLQERRSDLTIYTNDAVKAILAAEGIESTTNVPSGAMVEDVIHAELPNGTKPPNRAFTIDGVITHTGDSREPTSTAPILALPILVPWGSITGAVAHARRLRPAQVVPIHDFYLSAGGRSFARTIARDALAGDGIELIELDWGDSFSF